MKPAMTAIAMAICLLAAGAGRAWAQDQDRGQDRDQGLSGIRACVAIVEDATRLACFDRAVETLAPAANKRAADTGAVQAASPAATIASPASAAPNPGAQRASDTFGRPADKPAEPNQVLVVLSEIQRRDNGKLLFITESGQAWAQTDTTVLRNLGAGPWTGEIKRAALGSYLLVLEGRAAVRVRRDK